MRPRLGYARSSLVNNTALSRGRPERFHPTAWYRSDQGTTIATGVSQWNDLSGNANHLTQGTGSAQPSLVSNAYNGKPCIRFVSANSQILSKTSTDLIGTGAYTLVTAVKVNSSTGANALFGNTNTGAGTTLFLNSGPVRDVLHAGVAAFDGSAIQTTALEVWIAIRSAASKPSLLINNISQSLSGAATGINAAGGSGLLAVGGYFSAGVTGFADIDVTEAVLLARDISTPEASRLSGYTRARYGSP